MSYLVLNAFQQGVGDSAPFLRHVGLGGHAEGTGTISVRNACSRIFRESKSKVQSSVEALPGRDGFGTWQLNPCAPKAQDSLPAVKAAEGVEDTLMRLTEKQNLQK